ncbi:uncharacterized protein METZ01_LOCUS477389, partial [marine metagenome]
SPFSPRDGECGYIAIEIICFVRCDQNCEVK